MGRVRSGVSEEQTLRAIRRLLNVSRLQHKRAVVCFTVTVRTECYSIFNRVLSTVSKPLHMMHFKIRSTIFPLEWSVT